MGRKGTRGEGEGSGRLLAMRGSGTWTGQEFVMCGRGRKNMFPKGEMGIQGAVQGVCQLDDKPDDAFLGKVKQECEPYCSYAALYLGKRIESVSYTHMTIPTNKSMWISVFAVS